ncbi:NAD(P)-binding domain-containing protein [Streptomyces sp. NPDC054865]
MGGGRESGGSGPDDDDGQVGGGRRVHGRLLVVSTSVDGLPCQHATCFDERQHRRLSKPGVVFHLSAYSGRLDVDLRTGHRVTRVAGTDAGGFRIDLEGGARLTARAVIAASGSFGHPHRPALPGLDRLTGHVVHAADFRGPAPFAGRRVVVVGAGNSAVQIAVELARTTHTTLATRTPVRFARQRPLGRDLHFWPTRTRTGLDTAPLGRLLKKPPAQPVLDDGRYRAALAAGTPRCRPMFTNLNGEHVIWPDGTTERVDPLVLATG